MLEQQDLALINHTCSRGKHGGRYTPPLHTAREKQMDERDKMQGPISRKGTDEGWQRWKHSCTSTLDVMEGRDQGMRGGREGQKERERERCEGEGACRQSHLLN